MPLGLFSISMQTLFLIAHINRTLRPSGCMRRISLLTRFKLFEMMEYHSLTFFMVLSTISLHMVAVEGKYGVGPNKKNFEFVETNQNTATCTGADWLVFFFKDYIGALVV